VTEAVDAAAAVDAGAQAPPSRSGGAIGRLWAWLIHRPRRAALLCAVLGVLLHANTLGNEFAYDDVHVLIENEAIHDVENLPGLLVQPYWVGEFGDALGLWRPATTLSLGLQWALWQDLAWPYHLINALAHGVATGLVVLLLATLASAPIALVAGLIFAAHPVHAEAVANIVGLAEIQAAAFYLAACLLHARAAPALGEGRYGGGRVAAVAALYLGAFLSKESAVTLPGALFLIDAARERIGLGELRAYVRSRGAVFAALVLCAGAVLAGRILVLGSVAHPLGPLGGGLLEAGVPRVWTVAGIWTHYVRLMAFPLDLASDYSPNVIPIALGWTSLNVLGVVLAVGAMLLTWASWRDRDLAPGSGSSKLAGFGVLWFVIAISPISNVFFLAGVLLAERTLYLPSVGAVAVAGWLLVRFAERRREAGIGLIAVVVGLMGIRTWVRNPTWENNITVFETMLRDYPQSGRSQWVLGDLFFEQERIPEALASYRLAVGILGGYPQLLVQISNKLIAADRHDAARTLLLYAWRDDPSWAVAPGYLAVSHFQTMEWPEAEHYARISLEADPDQRVMPHVLAGALAEQGRYGEAIPWREFTIAQGESGSWEQWLALARLRLSVGDTLGAGAARDSALSRASGPEETRQIGSRFLPYDPPPGTL
jgi:hypothetical protein